MTGSLTTEQIRAARIAAQHLSTRVARASMLDAVRSVVGINAQFGPAMQLSLRARVRDLTVADIYEELNSSRVVVRTWAMRGTLHLLAAEDAGWIVGLLGPVFIPGGARRRHQLGLADSLIQQGAEALHGILTKDGPLNRDDIVIRLAERGVKLDRKSQAPVHLIAFAALSGLIVQGPDDEDGKPTYAAWDKWLRSDKKSISTSEALARLASRYVAGYGPASLDDFSAWSGLPRKLAKQGWVEAQERKGWQEVKVEERRLAMLSVKTPTHSSTVVNLLPAFDAYVLGYKHREQVVAAKHHKAVYHGGQTVPVVMINGEAGGVWRYDRRGKRLEITVRPFSPFTDEAVRLIHEEADDIGRFWDSPISVVI